MSKRHEYKTWCAPFQATWSGLKLFEIRKSRTKEPGFQEDPKVGDTVVLREYDPMSENYTGREVHAPVIYVLKGGRFGLAEDTIAIGLDPRIERIGAGWPAPQEESTDG